MHNANRHTDRTPPRQPAASPVQTAPASAPKPANENTPAAENRLIDPAEFWRRLGL